MAGQQRPRRFAPRRLRDRPSAAAGGIVGRPARRARAARRTAQGQGEIKAKAASGLVSNVKTGEIVAMVSLPDFDPNNPREAHDPERINRLTTGVYEMGSTFKALTLAMALDSGKATLNTMYDARGALHYGKFAIHDTHPEGRAISLSEVFTFSSNVGAARIALAQGVEAHKAFLKKLGQLDRLRTE